MYGELCELREQLFSHLRGYVYYYHNYRRKIKRRKLKQETIKNIIRSERISLQHAIFIFITLVLLFFAVFFFCGRTWKEGRIANLLLYDCKNFLRKRVFLEYIHHYCMIFFEDTNETKNSSIHKK